jgi:hypothetical protein
MPLKIQWGRIVAGALLLEVALIIVFVPLLSMVDMAILGPVITIGVFVFGFAITYWIVKRVRARHVLHGTLIGVLATAIYILLCVVQPGGIALVIAMYGPVQFFLGNALRILGCAAGGFAVQTRKS